ncbi:MAG: DnaJ domain-containing protein [Janthinobacterium lividum]
MSENYYQTLGVTVSAPAADIKRAYRRLATQLHPDKHQGDPRYEERFKAVAVAYGVLSDPARRAQYDYKLRQAAQAHAGTTTGPANGPSVYRAPTPAPAAPPLRTRRPAGARERHYQPRTTRQQVRFNRQDLWLVVGIVALLLLFGISAKIVMDRVAASTNYDDARAAYGRGSWALARHYLDQSLGFRDDQAPALQLRGQLAQDAEHDLPAARADYEAALAASINPLPPPEMARTLLRLGQCQAGLHLPRAAEHSYSRALGLDTTLAAAYLARGENRLLELNRTAPALADLQRGHRQYAATAHLVPLPYLQAEGAALVHLSRYPEARAVYEQALERNVGDGRTLYLLGRLAQQTADSVSACEFFRRGAAAGYGYAAQAVADCH